MKRILPTVLLVILVIVGVVFGLMSGFDLSSRQQDTLYVLGIICLVAILYCFIVGELSGNNSQMDKLWSVLPIIYIWYVAFQSGFSLRIVIMAILITLWGVRLTINFARKGAYTLKFWAGEEDYRWGYLRANTILKNRFLWAVFNLLFISIYQNLLVLAITLPGVAVMESAAPLNIIDVLATCLGVGFLFYEFLADEQQNSFQNKKWDMIKNGQALKDLPYPYNKGFNTTGLWAYSRHPNYVGEQMIWVSVYLFVIAAGVTSYGIFNWSIIGALLLIFLFLGSSTLSESISASKYPEYALYQEKVFRYLPIRKYRD